uniref:Activating signal cointegrator 1 complex subunit 3 n=1 Tax=Tetranychus urticae TaxID=32264 RepID=T1L4H7_TETUR
MQLIISLLNDKSKPHSHLESELMDLLGFGAIDLIREIIQNHQSIIKSHKSLYQEAYPGDQGDSTAEALAKLNSLQPNQPKKPSITQSVVVQTIEEKNLKKLIRKCEKKMMKEIKNEANDNTYDTNDFGKIKQEKERQLLESMSGPLFKRIGPAEREKYPFVFDNYAEAQLSAAFICGAKIALPAGFKRNDTSKWEEIEIPPCSKIPPDFLPEFGLIDIEKDLDPIGQKVFAGFKKLNKVQSIVYSTACNTNNNMLICAPTGAGKTNIAMLTILNELRRHCDPETLMVNGSEEFKIIYIAPMKALASEMTDSFAKRLKACGVKVKELTGDMQLSKAEIIETHMIITTPEKWDVVTRKPKGEVELMKLVKLLVIDEVHLLQSDRGPVVEALVARTLRHVESTQSMIRIVGLSATLPNYVDVATFLRVNLREGLFFFDDRFRPVPLGQTFIGINDEENNYLIQNNIKDSNLKLTLAFGIGLHHAGLHEKDRSLVEELFLNQKIQVLITTATLAWGVNLPAHLVVIKGTEFYDGKIHRYVDFPITDVLQMMGRAGRPQFDKEGIAVILVHDIKKEYYKKFLYEPFPVESHLIPVIEDHINAEIVAGTLATKSDCVEYLSWTYLFRRLFKNPSYYELAGSDLQTINLFLSQLTDRAINALQSSQCLEVDEDDDRTLYATPLGRISSFYYLNHKTVRMFQDQLSNDIKIERLLHILASAAEYNELPVRHNEDLLNEDLAKKCRFPVTHGATYDCSHTKAYLLLQSHFSRLELPSTDYYTDLKSVLDQAIRIIQAMIDISSMNGYLVATLGLISILQMIIQARWFDSPPFLTLPHVDEIVLPQFKRFLSLHLPELISIVDSKGFAFLTRHLDNMLDVKQIRDIYQTINGLPLINLKVTIKRADDESRAVDVDLDLPDTSIKARHYIELEADTDYLINFMVSRPPRPEAKPRKHVFAPKYAKAKDENWIFIIGDSNTRELIALKRSGFIGNKPMTISLIIRTPTQYGRFIYSLYLLSDALIGLDQQYDLGIDIVSKSGP